MIRLLIRRPECLGPALRGEGEGLLKAIVDANKMSEKIADRRKLREMEQDGDMSVSVCESSVSSRLRSHYYRGKK